LRYSLQYKIPSKSVQKVNSKNPFPFHNFENPTSCGKNCIEKKRFSLCYLQLLLDILFLRVTVDVAAAIHTAVHIKTGDCFNQYSTTQYTKHVNQSYILFECNLFWPIFDRHQVSLHDTPIRDVLSLEVLQMYTTILLLILNYTSIQNVELSHISRGVHC
jgi:hypothetical protein